MTFSSLFLPFRRTATALSLAALLGCTFAPAWSQQAAPKKELSEKVSEDLAKIRAATDAKTARLKALRLAQEQEAAAAAPPPKAKKPAKSQN